jgi:hypothetical protein
MNKESRTNRSWCNLKNHISRCPEETMKITISMPEEATDGSRHATTSASILGLKAETPSISYIKFTQRDVHRIGTDVCSRWSSSCELYK